MTAKCDELTNIAYNVAMKAFKDGCPVKRMKGYLNHLLQEEKYCEAEGVKQAIDNFEGWTDIQIMEYFIKLELINH